METVGLIPAGGIGERLGKLPCSKEVFPYIDSDGAISVISANLIKYFQHGGIQQIYFIIRKGKWDIPRYFGDGNELGVSIGYLLMNLPFGTPFTLNQAYPFIKDKSVALGFPDIVFKPENAFEVIKTKLENSKADIVLGLAATNNFLQSDMIEFTGNGSISKIIIKQNRPDLKYSWFIAIWNPVFTDYMHTYLQKFLLKFPDGIFKPENCPAREPYVGDIIHSALNDGLKTEYVLFENGGYLDLGTISKLQDYIQGKHKI